jgi:cytochrome c-type biogenesis protein CcsB
MDLSIVQNYCANTSFFLLLFSLLTYWFSIAFPYIMILKKTCRIVVIITNILISIILSTRWIMMGYFPLSNLYESLLFLVWCLTFIQIIVEQKTNSQIIGAISSPIELFIISFANLALPNEMQQSSPLVPALQSNWLMMHVTVIILSYACLLIGSLLSILFLVIEQKESITLRGNALGYMFNNNQSSDLINRAVFLSKKPRRMNLLESLDNLSYRIIGLGFPLLTIGIISGAVWANEAWGSYWSWDPKETWALITWLIFASYLHARFSQAWQGKKAAILASIGFLVVWICYLGVNFLGKGLHSYGWIP